MAKYKFPVQICTASMLGYMAAHDTELNIRKEDAYFYKVLDAMKSKKKSGIFGGAFLLSEKAAAEKAAAETFELSEREKQIIARLGGSKQ